MAEDRAIRFVLTAQTPSSVSPRRLLSEIEQGLTDDPDVQAAVVAQLPWSRQVEHPAPTAASADRLVGFLVAIRLAAGTETSSRRATAAVHRRLYITLRRCGSGVAALAAAPLGPEAFRRLRSQATRAVQVGRASDCEGLDSCPAGSVRSRASTAEA